MTNAESVIGRQIASYKVLSRIARGGMADVYLAEDMGLRRQVMLKIMLPHLARNEAFLTRFQREARTTARLSRPNIIQVYSTGLSPDGRPYLALQYIRGGTLHEKLANLAGQGQLLPARTALITVRQVAYALGVAHEAGIVHRDLKPSNILRHPDGTQIAFLSERSGSRNLHIMAADGSNSHLVLTSDDYEWGADWTPDGDKIVFTRERGDYSYIYVMDSDGSNVTYISERGSYPSWAR